MTESNFVVTGQTEGLVAALKTGGEALLDFAALSETAQARIVAALNGLNAGSGIGEIQAALAEIGRTTGFDALIQSASLVNAQFENGIGLVRTLQSEIAALSRFSVTTGGATGDAQARAAIEARQPLTAIAGTPQRLAITAGTGAAATGGALDSDVAAAQRLNQAFDAVSEATQIQAREINDLVGFFERLNISTNELSASQAKAAAGGGRGGGGGFGSGGGTSEGDSPQGFFAQFAHGFGGGAGKDQNPFAEQLGTIVKYTAGYGLAYTVLNQFKDGLATAVQQLEAFQEETITLAAVMGTTTGNASKLATQLGQVAVANGQSASVGVAAGARAIGLFGATNAPESVQAQVALQGAQVALQSAFLSGQKVEDIQAQIAATAQSFGGGSASQQVISDVDTYLSLRSGQAPGSIVAATSTIGSAGAAAGFDYNQLAATVATLEARTGQNGSTVAGYLQEILAKGSDPATEAKLAQLGVNINQTFQAQLAQLGSLNLSPQETASITKLLGSGTGKGADAAQILVGSQAQIAQSAQDAATKSAGATQEEFNAQMNTFRGLLLELHATLNDVLKDLGNTGVLGSFVLLAEASKTLLQTLDDILKAFDQIPQPAREIVSGVGLATIALGLLGRSAEAAAAKVASAAVAEGSTSRFAGVPFGTGGATIGENAGIGAAGGAVAGDILPALSARELAAVDAEGSGFIRAIGVGVNSFLGKVGNFFQSSAGFNLPSIAVVAATAVAIDTIYNSFEALAKAGAAVANASISITTDANAVADQADAAKNAQLQYQKASGGIGGFITSAYNNRIVNDVLPLSALPNDLTGNALRNNQINNRANADIAGNSAAAASAYVAQLQALQTQATNTGGPGALNLATADTFKTTFAALQATGADAATQMNALVSALNDVAKSGTAAGSALNGYQQAQAADLAGAGAAQGVAQNLEYGSFSGSDKKFGAGVTDNLSAYQTTIDSLTAQALASTGGKALSGDQQKQLVAAAQAQIESQIPNLDKHPEVKKAIDDGINLGILGALHQATGGTAGGSVDLASIQATIAAALQVAPTVATNVTSSFLAKNPGDQTGATGAGLDAEIAKLQQTRQNAAAALAKAGVDQGTITQTLSSLDTLMTDLGNQSTANALARIQAFESLNIANIGQYDALGKADAQVNADIQALGATPDDPALQAKRITDAQAQVAAKLANANSITTASVDPRNTVGVAQAALTDSERTYNTILQNGGGSGELSTAYADVVAKRQAVVQAEQDFADAAASTHVDSRSQIETTAASIVSLTARIKEDGAGTLQALQDQSALNQAIIANQQALEAAALVTAQLGSDTTNPATQAALLAAAAAKKLADDKASKNVAPDVIASDQLDLTQKNDSAQKAAFDQQLNSYQQQQQLGQISQQAYLGFLTQERSLLQTKLKTMKSTSDGYYQAQQELNEVQQAILAAAGSLNSQFNLAGIKIPTPYEVRRYLAGDQSGGTANGSNTVTINISGADTAAVQAVIGSYLGPQVIDSYSSITRKVG